MGWDDDSSDSALERWRKSSSGAKLTVVGLVVFVVFVFVALGGGGGGVDDIDSSFESQYAVVIDAGSSGSRVHVYEVRKEKNGAFNVVDELFEQLKPGLSAYKADPKAAAASLDPLLDKAAARVPAAQHSTTSIALGATAGLRMIGEAAAARILDEVRDHITEKYDFKIKRKEDVRILDGNEEGKYAWIAVNTLLGQVGRDALETYAACDLGGGSVQCMFAMPGDAASLRKGTPRKPSPPGYVESVSGGGRSYDLYVHSFLGYGLLAARMAVLKATADAPGACLPSGFKGAYQYGDASLAVAGRGTASFGSCRNAVKAALKQDKPCDDDIAPAVECPVDGQWVGGLSKLLAQSPQAKVWVGACDFIEAPVEYSLHLQLGLLMHCYFLTPCHFLAASSHVIFLRKNQVYWCWDPWKRVRRRGRRVHHE